MMGSTCRAHRPSTTRHEQIDPHTEHLVLRQLLVAARKTVGLTQQEVARRLERPQSFVAKYEGGERRLDVIEFVTVARALEQDPLELLRRIIAE